MAESKARKLSSLIDNTGDVKALRLDNVPNAVGVVGTQVYATPSLLPTTGLSSGDQAFVTSNQRLYITNGSGWYNVALINSTPTFTTGPDATYALSNDLSPTIITLVAQDSDGQVVTYSATDSGMTGIATLSQDSSVFTITPLTDSAGGTIGTFTLTFQATDGINIASSLSTFTLAFGPDWSGSATRSLLAPSDGSTIGQINAGESVSISGDGNYIAVAAPMNRPSNVGGSVYIYSKSGSTWSQQQKIQASDNGADDYFGDRVGMNSDGTYLISGAWYEDANGTNSGASYIFTRSGTTWTQQAKLNGRTGGSHNAGRSSVISSDGSYAAFGSNSNTSDAYSTSGSVTVFTRSGTSWSVQQKFQPADLASSDSFGTGVAMSDDATYIAASAWYQNSVQGSVYVWTRSGTTWSQQAKLTASDGAASDMLGNNNGNALDISGDANYIVAGAPGHDTGGSNAGAVYVWVRSGTSWTQQAKLLASDAQASDSFGSDVTINQDGSQIAVVAQLEDGGSGDPNTNTGSVYIFARSGTTWTQKTILRRNDFTPVSGRLSSASFSSTGDALVVGSIYDAAGGGTNVGAAHVYDLD